MTTKKIAIDNLINIQTDSFKGFLKKGLKSEMYKYNHIVFGGFDLLINVSKLRYKQPLFSVDFCISNKKTYSVPVFIPVKIKFNDKLVFNKYVFFGELPLLTDKGCFVINGNLRVLVNQIVRSPGVYFEKLVGDKGFFATIVPYRGSWITLKMDF